MYLEFYSLKEKPFSLTPDPAFLYNSNIHKRAIAFLKYGLQEYKGFLQLTGPVGSGKTTLLRVILSQLGDNTKTAYIINPSAPFPDLLLSIMKDLEIPDIPQTRIKLELLDFFHDYLLVQLRRSNQVIVIIDEAQNLSLKNLEEIRMLSNFETTKEKLIQIVFVGQPELIQILDRPELRQLKQRIQVRYHLSPLKLTDVKAYIDHRLHVAGSDGSILFTDEACATIYDYSGGIPRLINSVCDVVLLIGYVNECRKFDCETVKEAIREMGGIFNDDPPVAGSGEVCSTASRELRGKGESAGLSQADPVEKSFHSTDSHSDSSPGQVSADIAEGRRPDLNRQHRSTGYSTSAAQIPDEGQTLHETSARLSRVPASLAEREISSRNPVGTSKLEPTPAQSTCSHSRRISFKTQQKMQRGSLHSRLRHNSTTGFHATGFASTKLMKPRKDMRARIKECLKECVADRNGSVALNMKKTKCRPLKEHASSHTVDKAMIHNNNEKGNLEQDLPSKMIKFVNGISKWIQIFLTTFCPSERIASRKIAILFKEGTIARGLINNITLTESGFYYFPFEKRYDTNKKFVPFEQVAAVYLAENIKNDFQKKSDDSVRSPKGREIMVKLVNGEEIKGITLNKFDAKVERFFILCPFSNGDVSWVLVEKSGTVGILTEDFKEGIYCEEVERLEN